MKVENIYTSIGCNRTTESADWGQNGLIIYAANNAVALYQPNYLKNSAKILEIYLKHSKRVNTVKWLQSCGKIKEHHFISGSDDSLAIFWNIERLNEPVAVELKGHKGGVYAVSGLQYLSGEWLLATTAADSTIKLWSYKCNENVVQCIQTLSLNSGFCFTLKLTWLSKADQVLLAFSTDNGSIDLWVNSANMKRNFQPVHKLMGHEDWVRGLDFVEVEDELLVASCSQDNFIRLWRLSPRSEEQVLSNKSNNFNILCAGDIRMEEKIVHFKNSWYAISVESVLYGHEGWVYGVHWHKSKNQDLRLLSSSIDKTLIIWQFSKEAGIWIEKVRLGDVGGHSLGFFGGKFSTDGCSVLGHSYEGALHLWTKLPKNENLWVPQVVVGGHFDEVRDLAWDRKGEYLITVSADQTTRIHAPWRQSECKEESWHELARPQVHGYDIQALALLTRYRFASGAQEKIVRIFQAPANFVENFKFISKIENDPEDILLETLPEGASVPSLGLSNKAVYNTTKSEPLETRHVKDEYPENYFVAVSFETPPQEETLKQNTLWPEIQKLYGHGYEIYALAASPDGHLLASSCKSTNAEHAQIILWNTCTWKQMQKLTSHQLTVTQMRFSPNGKFLLSVSRDRRWSLFERQSVEGETSSILYALIACTEKSNGIHTRIIWSCDWSHDNQYFITTSREGKAVVWTNSTNEIEKSLLNGWQSQNTLELTTESITAVCFADHLQANGSYLVALGCESGIIYIYQYKDSNWSLLKLLSKSQAHHLAVKRLQFRPLTKEANNYYQLASCGEDHLVRIYAIQL
uniref:Elongator complex protein 2 n=1 Tax=Glossina brevipalpis TaxID=37001 RepID=A0A1A9WBK9_9MUSC